MVRINRIKNKTFIRLGIAFPTNEPNTTIDLLLPTIHHLRYLLEIQKIKVFFGIVFQPPWTERQIRHVVNMVEAEGFFIYYEVVPAAKSGAEVKLNWLRELSARKVAWCDYILMIDDDFKFTSGTKTVPKSSGQVYGEMIDYMERHPRCGIMETRAFLGGTQQGQKIIPIWDWIYYRGVGQLNRNLPEVNWIMTPPSTYFMKGGMEDPLPAFSKMEMGYYCALRRNVPTIHRRKSKLASQVILDEKSFNCIHVLNKNAYRWIRDRYDCPTWSQGKKCPVPYDLYISKGGPDFLYDDTVFESLVVDYKDGGLE